MAGTPGAPLSPDAGPTDPHLPKLPSGWIAQWDSSSRKYYYVQISTGVSQWDLPTSEAPAGPSRRPEQIPASACENAGIPDPASAPNGKPEEYSGDRGLGSTAFNLLASQHGGGKQSSGIGSLATSLLNSSSSHSSNSHSGGHSSGTAGLVGSLASNLLGGSKPHGQQQQGSHSGSSSSHQSSGLGSVLGGILGGGSHGSHGQQNSNYGYSSGAPSSGGYSGTAPPAQYNPAGSASHTPSSVPSYPGQPGYNNQYSSPNPQSGHNQYAPPAHTSSFGQPPQHAPSFGPQSSSSWGPQAQGTPSFPPPPPAQPQQHHQGSYGSTPHDASQTHGGYFNQAVPQGAYGQHGQHGGYSNNQHPPPPPAGSYPQGNYTAVSYGQPSPHAGFGQSPVQHQQGGYSGGFSAQAPNGQHNAYGQGQHQTGYHGSGAPSQPGW
ncbi:WW/Rsp5/WWP [Lasiodiplodia theobromae]|uniref:Protein transport protein SEC24 n=1 Tax=Lasiodiplodia theobromae TaxID=45133 RepID=A0A5N5DNY8_9PEZI|nr:Protein transport protein SEC24 [Lasiodiplodia theobromae]KAF9633978.1 WW/Rsp5/WWP [Lasiodiplodia theobromae]